MKRLRIMHMFIIFIEMRINSETLKSSRILQQLRMPVLTTEQCSQSEYWSKIPDIRFRPEHMCAGGEAGKDSCKGDSGGPLIIEDETESTFYLVGIVSFGARGCGAYTAPAIYTRVALFANWIKENVKE
jgi:secreted trypsin-like serine protease